MPIPMRPARQATIDREFSATTNRRIGKGLLFIAACFALIGAWRWHVEARFLETATIAYGHVVSVSSKQDNAKVVFQDSAGRTHTISPSVRSSLRSYQVGERIVVLVSPLDPQESKFNESLQIWSSTHAFLYLSALCGTIGFLVFKRILRVGPLYQKRISIGL